MQQAKPNTLREYRFFAMLLRVQQVFKGNPRLFEVSHFLQQQSRRILHDITQVVTHLMLHGRRAPSAYVYIVDTILVSSCLLVQISSHFAKKKDRDRAAALFY